MPKGLLTVLWAAALAVAVFADTDACSAADPGICGPDQAFAFWFTIALATPVLLLWLPLAGCAAGIAFGLADVFFDDVPLARVAFALHAAACAAVAAGLVRGGVRQERLVAPQTSPVRVPAALGGPEPGRDPDRPGWYLPPLFAVVLLVLLAAGSFGWYAHAASGERAHVRRADRVEARVVEVDADDWTVTVEYRPPAGVVQRHELDVYEITDYPVGGSVALLVDASDRSWARLVAEPQDITWWESIGYGAVLLALVLLGREVVRRRAVPLLLTREATAVRVLAVPDENGDVLVLPFAEGRATHPVARIPVAWLRGSDADDGPMDASSGDPAGDGRDDWDEEVQASFGRAWRGERALDDESEAFSVEAESEPQPALLVGSLRDRGWALLVTEEGTLVPAGPMRVGRVDPDGHPWWRPWGSRLTGGAPAAPPPARPRGLPAPRSSGENPPAPGPVPQDTDDDGVLPGRPVAAGALRRFPELPLDARPPARLRLAGSAVAVTGFLGGPLAALLLVDGWYQPAVALTLGFEVMVFGLNRALPHVVLTGPEAEVRGPWRTHHIPWGSLHGVRRAGGVLHLAWEPDLLIRVGPFGAAPEATSADRAEQVGALMLTLRSWSADPRGRADRPLPSTRPGPAWGYATAYALVTLGVVWALLS